MRETHAELEQSRDESMRRQQQINDLTAKNEDLTVQVRAVVGAGSPPALRH